ncbi:ABC transporter permease subunit [Rhizobium sp. BK376]|uniref:ABC transporter permease n=1 Tax=Rhizobium sp. BK376 TaxID=2512149 RepID=UPI001053ABEE|nr:ABC transporter permease subunit [Rhizobium sp. BK376]TCR85472.1 putative spermidine/putrescine transport system permease protein [Rhizobium sp. BK376]
MTSIDRARARRGEATLRLVILFSVLGYLLLPMLAMFEFSTRGPGGQRTLAAWAEIGTNPDLLGAIILQLELAALTVLLALALLVPTMILVRLKRPGLNRVLEFICLLPLTVPAIVLVVGLGPVYGLVGRFVSESPLTLTFIYVILVLPYNYRAIASGLDTLDLVTLSEAARVFGSSWNGVIWRIVVPNIRGALLAAALISVALVLGEFTISSLLSFETLQVIINEIGKRNASVAVAVSLAALCFAFMLLFILSFAGQRPEAREIPEKEE